MEGNATVVVGTATEGENENFVFDEFFFSF
jgi:hypothetical protein